jgi:hypothetical protein
MYVTLFGAQTDFFSDGMGISYLFKTEAKNLTGGGD